MIGTGPPSTPRIRFRRLTPDDIDLLVDLDSDPEVMRWLTGGKPSTRAYYEQAMPRILSWYQTGPSRGFFAAERPGPADPPGPSTFVGWFHLREAHHWPGELELGYRLKREAWGQGLATEGSIGLIRHALHDLGEPLVIAATMLGNAASQRVMQKAGMVPDAEFLETRWAGPDQRAVKYIARAGVWRPPDSLPEG